MSVRVRRDDTVQVVRGKDRGKRGKVQRVIPADGRLVVEGVNIVKRHVKPRAGLKQTGIVQQEAPVNSSKVMPVCPHCNRPARVGFRTLEDGTKVRVCRKCQATMD